MRKFAYNFYHQSERLIAPGLRFSQTVYESILKQNVNKDSLWLDIGCGHNILPNWRLEEEQRIVNLPRLIVGLDSDLSSLLEHKYINNKIKADIQKIPFKDNSFNLLTANMVFEHLKEPEQQLREIFRVLKPGGLAYFSYTQYVRICNHLCEINPRIIEEENNIFSAKERRKRCFSYLLSHKFR